MSGANGMSLPLDRWAQDALVAQEISLKTTKASWLHPVREMSLPLPGIAMQLAKDPVPGPSWPYFLQPRCQWPVNHVCWIHGHDNFTLVSTHGNIDDMWFTTRYIIWYYDQESFKSWTYSFTASQTCSWWTYEIAIMWIQCLETPLHQVQFLNLAFFVPLHFFFPVFFNFTLAKLPSDRPRHS